MTGGTYSSAEEHSLVLLEKSYQLLEKPEATFADTSGAIFEAAYLKGYNAGCRVGVTQGRNALSSQHVFMFWVFTVALAMSFGLLFGAGVIGPLSTSG